METQLDKIAEGQDTYLKTLTEFEKVFEPLLEKAYANNKKFTKKAEVDFPLQLLFFFNQIR